MRKARVDYTKHFIEKVTEKVYLWDGKDPVRPWLSASFRTSSGREVYGLSAGDDSYSAFVCVALTSDVPRDEKELKSLAVTDSGILIPYTVWSSKRGAGKALINKLIELARKENASQRIVTLSPISLVAKRFHIKNGAKEIRRNDTTINFEY